MPPYPAPCGPPWCRCCRWRPAQSRGCRPAAAPRPPLCTSPPAPPLAPRARSLKGWQPAGEPVSSKSADMHWRYGTAAHAAVWRAQLPPTSSLPPKQDWAGKQQAAWQRAQHHGSRAAGAAPAKCWARHVALGVPTSARVARQCRLRVDSVTCRQDWQQRAVEAGCGSALCM